jgi:hypothetical protein
VIKLIMKHHSNRRGNLGMLGVVGPETNVNPLKTELLLNNIVTFLVTVDGVLD